MAHSLTTIGRRLECATQTELVVEPDIGPTPNWKEAILSISIQFCYMPEGYKRVLVGWHCAKVKGYVELKIEQPQSN